MNVEIGYHSFWPVFWPGGRRSYASVKVWIIEYIRSTSLIDSVNSRRREIGHFDGFPNAHNPHPRHTGMNWSRGGEPEEKATRRSLRVGRCIMSSRSDNEVA